MSTLSLDKAASLQQEKEAQSQRPLYNTAPPPTEAPLMAPQPQRAPASGVWTPDMPISFGAPAVAGNVMAGAGGSGQKGKAADGRWDPKAGLRFS